MLNVKSPSQYRRKSMPVMMRQSLGESDSSELPIFAAFQSMAARNANKKAIKFEDSDSWTYSQVADAVQQLSLDLTSRVPAKSHVCVLLPRSPAQVVTILAIARLGAIYVPIDPSLPESRIDQILASLPSPVAITQPGYETKLPSTVAREIISGSGDHGLQLLSGSPTSNDSLIMERNVQTDDLAAVLFTSGSTGTAKGVQLSHRNLILPVRMLAERQHVNSVSSVFQFSQPSFDMHLVDILTALLHGASLLQVSQENLMTDLPSWIKTMQPDTIHLTPSIISMLKPSELPSLRYMVTCGEPVTRHIIDTWAPHIMLTNLYGPCEASSIVAKRLGLGDDTTVVGRPSPYASILVLDMDAGGTVQPVGVAGEIVVRGGSVFQGYCNADSSSRLLDSVNHNGRLLPGPWYATGDHGCINGDGELQLLGRADDQVKVNGQRVELGEIEHVVQQHAGRVVARAYKIKDNTRLFALVSTQFKLAPPGQEIEEDVEAEASGLLNTILEACRAKLPSYMVPRVIAVKALPQSNSGKLDLTKIQRFVESIHERHQQNCSGVIQDDDTLEGQIANLFSQVLQQQVQRSANLFERGMTSMDAMRAIQAIYNTTGRRISFRDLLGNPTIEAISQICNQKLPQESRDPIAARRPSHRSEPLNSSCALSLGQESIYNACRVFGDGSHAYICTFAFEITSHINPSLLLSSVEAVYFRHESFNCTFVDSDVASDSNNWSETVKMHPKGTWPERTRLVPCSETLRNPECQQSAIFEKQLLQDAKYDLRHDAPAWCSLYQIDQSGSNWLLIFKFHHLVLDEFSFHQFWFEVLEMYRHNHTASLPKPQVTYRHFAALHRQDSMARSATDKTWWLQRGRGFKPRSLIPGIQNKPGFLTESSNNAFLWRCVPAPITERFMARYARDSSAFTAWFSICQILLHKYFGPREFLLGVPSSHRVTYPQFMDVIGYCVSVVPIPVLVDAVDSFSSHMVKAVANYWECVAHEQPIEQVLRWFTEAGSSDRPPSLEVMFNYHDRPRAQLDDEDRPFSFKQLDFPPRPGSHTSLQMHVDNSLGVVRLGLEYQTSKFNSQEIGEIMDAACGLVKALAEEENIDQPIASISFVSAISVAKNVAPLDSTHVDAIVVADEPLLLRALKECWCEILSTDGDNVDVNRSFFKAGGDSISAIRFCAKAKSKGIRGCKVSSLYTYPRLADLVKNLTMSADPSSGSQETKTAPEQQPSSPKSHQISSALQEEAMVPQDMPTDGQKIDSPPTQSETVVDKFLSGTPTGISRTILNESLTKADLFEQDVESIYKPTEMQTSMLLQSQYNAGTYISQFLLHFDGPLDVQKLKGTWTRVVDAHPALRTVFIPLNDPMQPYLAVEVKARIASVQFETMEAEIEVPSQDFEQLLDQDRIEHFAAKSHSLLRVKLLQHGADQCVMIVTCHHSILDGWSLGNIMVYLREAYHGHEIAPGISFSKVVSHRMNMNQDMRGARVFWKRHLRHAIVPELTSADDKEAPRIQEVESTASEPISSSLLQAVATRFQVTPFTIFQAALALALPSVESGKTAFWVVTSGRGGVDRDIDAIGNFLISVPCVVDTSQSSHLDKWLKDTQDSFRRSSQYDHLPVNEIMKCFQPTQSSINTLLVYENHQGAASQNLADNVRLTHIEGREHSDLAFTAVVEPGCDDTRFTAKYDENIIPSGVARRVLGRFSAIVKSICYAEDHHASIAALVYDFHYAEKSYCLQQSLDLDKYETQGDTLLSLFRSAVSSHPSQKALSNGSWHVTFSELDVLSDRLASQLRDALGERRGTVAILLDKSIFTVVAFIGVLKTGAAYCPLGFDVPRCRLDLLIRKVNASAIVSNRSGFERLGVDALLGLEAIDIEAALTSPPGTYDAPCHIPVTPEMPCYILFTSGTTSEPKACVLTHGAVTSSVKEAVHAYGLQESSRVLLFANYIFDASVTDIYGSLFAGACLFLLPDEDLKTDLIGCINRLRISWLHVTPTMLNFLPQNSLMPTLRTVVLGGEPISNDLRDRWANNVELIGAYGPTEAAVQVMTSYARRDSEATIHYQTLPGNLVVLVNKEEEICHLGEPGEILISGRQLFSGYYRDFAATESSRTFVKAFGNRQFYRTGDLGRWSADMKIQILGRKDDQIKVSGMRISPAEVEAVLESHQAVLRAAVVVHQGKLYAVLQARHTDVPLNKEEIAEMCESKLPRRLIPVMIQVEAIPTLPSQKIDRKRLKESIKSQRRNESHQSEPSKTLTGAETGVESIVREILGTDVVDANAPLQTLGLDSLGFMLLRGRLVQKYNLDLSYSAVRRARTLHGVAKLVSNHDHNLPDLSTSVNVERKNSSLPKEDTAKGPESNQDMTFFPALPSQTLMWLAQERSNDTTYNVQRLLEMDRVAGEDLLMALLKVTSSFDIFKTTFNFSRSAQCLQQVFHPKSSIRIEFISLRDNHDEMAQVRHVVQSQQREVFDLGQGPLAVFKVFACNGSRCYLWSNIHHIIVDAYTNEFFLQALKKVLAGEALHLPKSNTGSLALSLLGKTESSSLSRWVSRLRGAPRFLPAAPRPKQSPRYISLERSLHLGGIKPGNAPSFDFLLSLFQGLMHRYTDSDDLVVSIPISVRGSTLQSTDVLGNLGNTALMRSYLSDKDTLPRFVQRTRDDIDFALETNLPLGEICSAAGIDLRHHSVLFVFASARGYEDERTVDRTLEVDLKQRPMFDLTWHVFLHADRIVVRIDFDGSKHSEVQISAIADSYIKLVHDRDEIQNERFGVILDKVLVPSTLSAQSESFSDDEPASPGEDTPFTGSEIEEPASSVLKTSTETNMKDCEQAAASYGFYQRIRSGLQRDRSPGHVPAQRPEARNIHYSSSQDSVPSISTRVEKELAACASRVLNQTILDPETDLRELGMDSFASMTFISEIYAVRPDFDVSIFDILQNSTIRSLALKLTQGMMSGNDDHSSSENPDISFGNSLSKSITQGFATVEVEDILQKALYTSLNLTTVDVEQNLREVGLDSFASMAFISDVYSLCPHLDISLFDVFEHSTIRELAAHLTSNKSMSVMSSPEHEPSLGFVPPASEHHESPTLILSHCKELHVLASSIQRHFFLLQQQLCDTTYSLPSLHRVENISINQILEAVKTIAQSHEIFRTTLRLEGADVMQVIGSDIQYPYSLHDLQLKDRSIAEDELRRRCQSDCSKEFDLERGPLFRFAGYTLPGREQYLFLNFHHAIADQQSVDNLLRHAISIATGTATKAMDVIPASYVNFSERQRKSLQGENAASAKKFWRDVLSTAPLLHAWGCSKTDPMSQFTRAASFQLAYDFESDPVKWAYALGATSFGTCLFAFQILLALRSGTTANGVLIPASCRSPRFGEYEGYGCYVNTLPMCLDLSRGGSNLHDGLRYFMSTLARSLSFSHVPFESILDWGFRKMTDFDVSFVYTETSTSVDAKRDTFIKPASKLLLSAETSPKFPITFFVTVCRTQHSVSMQITVEYNAHLVAEEDARKVCSQYEMLLRLLHARSGRVEVSELKKIVCGPSKKLRLIQRGIHGTEDASIDLLPYVDARILEQARQRPNSTALIFEDQSSATYGELARTVYGLTRFLLSSPSVPNLHGMKVCVVGDVSIERLALLIALMSLGAAYVPIDFKNPAEWNMQIISDCTPACVLFLPDRGQLPGTSLELMRLLTMPNLVIPSPSPQAETMPLSSLPQKDGTDLAYVLYTSGSTGSPKGVAVDHRALRNSVHEHARIFQLTPQSRLLGVAPWTFDVSVFDNFGPLSIGASLVLGRRDWVFSALEEVVDGNGVTHISTTPTVAALMDPENVPTIASLGLGGEPMTQLVRDTWATRICLMNVYGPTEAAVDVITRQVFAKTEVANIGWPLRNVFIYILDEQMQQVPQGSTGQIAIGGSQVARGYIKNPAGKPSPFVEHDQYGRLYLTGDLGRFESDGSIVCLGRIDFQVKCRGQRIELGAIERVVDEVLQGGVCVALKITRGSQESLVAIFTDRTTGSQDASPVLQRRSVSGYRDFINSAQEGVQAKLPSYFMPSYWIPVTNFPRNNNQKLERKAVQSFVDGLEASELQQYQCDLFGVGTRAVVAPEHQPKLNAAEQVVTECFRKVLGNREFCKESNFFSLGGDSISTIRLATAIRAISGGSSIRVRDIYENPTIEKLCSLLDLGITTGEVRKVPVHNVMPNREQCSMPTTPVMDWFFRSRRANKNWFNQGHCIQLNGGKTFADLRDAWNKIVELHPMLRMRFVDTRTIAVANFQRDDFVVMQRQVGSMGDFVHHAQDLQASLDVANGPISALGAFQVQGDFFYPLFVHHLAVDVVSWHIILGDLDDILQGREVSSEFSSFKEWSDELSQRQRSLPQTEQPSIQLVENNFLGSRSASILALNTHESGSFNNLKLPSSILSVADKHGVQPVDFILAGLVIALTQWTGADQVELCFESHGRDLHHERLDTTRTVGWFTYMFPIAFHAVSMSLTTADFFTQVQKIRIEAMDSIDHAAPVHFKPGAQHATFNYLGQGTNKSSYKTFQKAHVDTGPAEDPRNIRPFVFDFESSINDGQLNIGVFYCTALHSAESINGLLRLWAKSLESFGEDSVETISQQQKQQLLLKTVVPDVKFALPDTLEAHRKGIESCMEDQGIPIDTIERIIPTTDIQATMMMASIGSRSYMHSYEYSLDVADMEAFCEAWEEVLSSRHSIFRTMILPLAKVPNHLFKTNLFQFIIKKERARGQFVRRRQPPKVVEAGFGQLLCSLYVYRTSSGDHRVKWFCHHSLMDAWSRNVVFDEVRALYGGLKLSTLPTQYSDLTMHMHMHSDQHRSFWAEYLGGAESSQVVEVQSSEINRPHTLVNRHHRARISVDPEDLDRVATSLHTTVPTLYKAAWALTLALYLSSEDVTFGTVTAGRASELPGIDRIVGPCLNTLPMRVKIDWSTTISRYIQQVSGVNLDIAEHEGVSLRKVYDASGKTNLFNTTLMVPLGQAGKTGSRKFDSSKAQLPTFVMKLEDRDEVTDVPILISVERGVSVPHTSVIDMRVHGHDFSDVYLLRLVNSFGKALEHIASLSKKNNTDPELGELDLLDASHHAEIARLVHGPAYPIQYDWTCWELFERQVRLTPSKVAIEYHEGTQSSSVTYEKLMRLAETGAKRLAAAGARPRARVALFLDKSVELVASILAVHRLDCAYTPIDIDSPTSRIETLLRENKPTAVLCTTKLKPNLPRTSTVILTTEVCFSEDDGSSEVHCLPRPTATLEDPAAVLFTSGTTGVPKGVLMPHRQVVGYGVLVAQALGYASSDRIFGFARPVFDISQSDVFGSFFAGATLVLTPHAEAMARLSPLLAKHRITSVGLTPSVASLISPSNLPLLRSLNVAGEVGLKTVIDKWASVVRMVNGYGPCEGVVVTWKHDQPNSDPRNIGTPSIGMQVYLLNEHMRSVPIGSQGTIWVSGHQLSLGYFGRETAAFRENPFGPGLIYNTGDCGVYDTAGDIIYLGRKDRQVKLNGRRVELSEIENSLSSSDTQVAVMKLKNDTGKEECVAFHGQASGQHKDIALCETTEQLAKSKQLERKARESLPAFMMPRRFIPVTNIPLTGNGKVDQTKLRQLYDSKVVYKIGAKQQEATGRPAAPPPRQHQAPRAPSPQTDPSGGIDQLVRFPSPNSTSTLTRKLNLFLFYAVTGISIQYRHLATSLPSFNVIGVDNLHLDDPEHYSTLTSMAQDHATLIRKKQPHGPYLLGGFSFAAHVAWVVGQHLRGQGEDVRLVLIDAEATFRTQWFNAGSDISDDGAWERNFDIPRSRSAASDQSREVEAFRRALLRQAKHNLRLLSAYAPTKFDGPVLVLKKCVRDDGRTWREGDVDKVLVGDHGGECSRGNGFDLFVKGELTARCVPTTDHYAMLKQTSCLQSMGALIEGLVGRTEPNGPLSLCQV